MKSILSKIFRASFACLLIVFSILSFKEGEVGIGFFLGGVLFGTGILLATIFENRLDDWIDLKKENRNVKIKADHFYFPSGYRWQFGYMKKKRKLPFNDIDELWLNTFPPAALVNGNELIFLTGITLEDLQKAPQLAKVPTAEPFDTWMWLAEEFLDTEHEEDWQQQTLKKLAKQGFSSEEVVAIRKKIGFALGLAVLYSWEWMYLGHFNVLESRAPLSAKTYWWSMEIALRNNQKKNQIELGHSF